MAYKGLASLFGKPLQESLPEIVTVEDLLNIFNNKEIELTPTSDKIVTYTDAERQTSHVKVPIPLPLPDNIQPTIEINPKISQAVGLKQALIIGVVNGQHSLCLVIIYDTETDRYMCYSFGVGGHDDKLGFSIYQPDFTLVGLNSFYQNQDQNMIRMSQNIRGSRIVDIQLLTKEFLNKYVKLFHNTTMNFRYVTNNFCNLISKKKKERTSLNCAFALSNFLDINTSVIGIPGIFDQGHASVAKIPMNTGWLYSLVNEFIWSVKEASEPPDDPALKRGKLSVSIGGTRRRKTNKRKERRTMKKRKGRKTKKKR